jgi:hypothetical protein
MRSSSLSPLSHPHIPFFWLYYVLPSWNYPQNPPTRHGMLFDIHARASSMQETSFLDNFFFGLFFFFGGVLGEDRQKVDGEPSISSQGRLLGILPEDVTENSYNNAPGLRRTDLLAHSLKKGLRRA